jgi:ubiquinone/menaquinone biosynthesis C-methylase UbiE/uncharacterized protein YbaR (Trm112 family)
MHQELMESLVCPRCHGELSWKVSHQTGSRIETADLSCGGCGERFEVRDGIGNFLLSGDAGRDLWQEAESGLTSYLREHPQVRSLLMDQPVEGLSPADLYFRAIALEESQSFTEALRLEKMALEKIYSETYRSCWESQVRFVLEFLQGASESVIDLASGHGYLVEKLLQTTIPWVVATDVSPRVLRRNRLMFEHAGLYDRLSLIAFDARHTPFRTQSVQTLTTNLGLPNISDPENLLAELRRIVDGVFLCITHFYPEDDALNAEALRDAGFSALMYRQSTMEHFRAAGWTVDIENECRGLAKPTPASELIEGAGIDAFPVQDTTLEWCVIVAH